MNGFLGADTAALREVGRRLVLGADRLDGLTGASPPGWARSGCPPGCGRCRTTGPLPAPRATPAPDLLAPP